jgi:hypothetical protein
MKGIKRDQSRCGNQEIRNGSGRGGLGIKLELWNGGKTTRNGN